MSGNSVWEPCKPYVSLFEKYANANNLPPILVRKLHLPAHGHEKLTRLRSWPPLRSRSPHATPRFSATAEEPLVSCRSLRSFNQASFAFLEPSDLTLPSQDKCGSLGASACASPDYNIRTAADYFSTQLASSSGEFLVALGAYNVSLRPCFCPIRN